MVSYIVHSTNRTLFLCILCILKGTVIIDADQTLHFGTERVTWQISYHMWISFSDT